METGQVRPSLGIVELWLTATAADEATRSRVTRLAEDAQVDVAGWRTVVRGGLARRQRQMQAFDATAKQIRWFQPFMVPGPFQPPEYARALIVSLGEPGLADRDLDAAVRARAERGRLLRERGTPFVVVATQTGLNALPIGVDPSVRRDVWKTMLAASEFPQVTVRIIPAEAPMLSPVLGGWVMYDLGPDAVEPVVVQVETVGAMLTFSGADVPPYEQAWERVLQSALDPDQSRQLLEQLLLT